MLTENKVSRILYRQNIVAPSLIKESLTDKDFYQSYYMGFPIDLYTSYNNYKNTYEEQVLGKKCNYFYLDIISEIMRQYNLRFGTQFDYSFWWQIYTNQTANHHDHTHYNPNNGQLFSFVHFINVDSNDPCFHFVNEDGTEEYINEKSNDFIFFGSWCRHRVKKSESSDVRAIIAGNVIIDQHISGRQFF